MCSNVLTVGFTDAQSTLSISWLIQGCHHPAHTSLPASVGFLWVKLHLHPAAEDLLTRGDSPKNTAEWILNEGSHGLVLCVCVCVCVCVSCVCSGLTKQDFCLFTSPRLFLVPVRISLTFVWLRQLLPLIQAAATEKHSKLGCKHNESVCVTGTSTMCTNMFSFVVFSMKTLEIYAGGLAADVAAQLDGGIPLETNDSAAPWWLKEELQLGAQWIHPSSSLPVIIIGGIGWCWLMVSWPISSKLYHTEGEKKFRAGDINQI